jgi:type IV secretory pathway TrbL component
MEPSPPICVMQVLEAVLRFTEKTGSALFVGFVQDIFAKKNPAKQRSFYGFACFAASTRDALFPENS